MPRLFAIVLITAACQPPVFAAETSPPFAPGAHKLKNGQPNEVMVLGPPHLSQMPKTVELTKFDLPTDRLTEWKPPAVAIESPSGTSSPRTGCCAPNKTRRDRAPSVAYLSQGKLSSLYDF